MFTSIYPSYSRGSMKPYSFVVRCLVVGLAATLFAQGTPVGSGLKEFLFGDQSSHQLLYSKNSPFQSEDLLALSVASSTGPQTPGTSLSSERFEHTVKKGTTLASLWRELKGAPAAVHSFIDAFSGRHPKLKAGEVVSVTKRGDDVVELRRDLGAGATLVISGDSEGGYVPRIEQMKVTLRERAVSGVISSSLVDAAREIDLPYSLVDDFVDLFGSRVEFRRDLQPGDTFTVSYEERVTEDGRVIDAGTIRAASLFLSGDMYAVVRDIANDGTVRYFDEKGSMPTKSFLRYPVQFTRIGSMFSTARFHPILHVLRPHNGVDFSAPIGTPVRSVGDGVVVHSGYSATTGYMVRIAHDARYVTEYMHLSTIAKDARKGALVQRGEVIGKVGSTGLSSGPHLHFGLFDRGSYVDPMKAKIIQSAPEIKAPKAVLAAIADMRKTHKRLALEGATTSKKRA